MAMGGVALNLWALPLMSLSQGCRRLFEPSPPVYEKGINYLHLRNQVPLPAGSAQPSPAQPARVTALRRLTTRGRHPRDRASPGASPHSLSPRWF